MKIEFNPENHQYLVDGVEVMSVTQILKESGFDGEKDFILTCMTKRGMSFEESEAEWQFYGDRGTAVHKATELLDKGELDPDSVDEVCVPYLDAYNLFLQDHDVDWSFIELPVANEFYAGTIDRIGAIDGRKCIADLKTSAILRPPVQLQLTGYGLLYENFLNIDNLFAIQLKKDGTYKIKEYGPDVKTWNVCVEVAMWKQNKRRKKC